MALKWQAPQFSLDKSAHFSIRQGELTNCYITILKHPVLSADTDEDWDYSGSCVYSVTTTDYYCQGNYSFHDSHVDKNRYTVVIVFQEAATLDLTFDSADVWTGHAYMKNNIRRKLGGSGAHSGWDCDDGPPAGGMTLDNMALHSVLQGSWAWNDWDLDTYYAEGTLAKSWFRSQWNDIMIYDTINPLTTAAPHEPSGNRFAVWTGMIYEQNSMASVSGGGWCHVSGVSSSAECAASDGVGCLRYPSLVSYSNVQNYKPMNAPSVTYPIKIERDGALFDYYPGNPTTRITYYDADNYP